jgi:hypothetical protein
LPAGVLLTFLFCFQLMEAQLDEWMDCFHTFLTFTHAGLSAADASGMAQQLLPSCCG